MTTPSSAISRADRDRKIRQDILQFCYRLYEDGPYSMIDGAELVDKLGYSKNELDYAGRRLDADGLIHSEGYIGAVIGIIRITAEGIEALHAEGHPTFLSQPTRYKILKLLDEKAREVSHAYIGRHELIEALGEPEVVVDCNMHYLNERRYVEADGGSGAVFWGAQITQQGSQANEDYELNGTEFPGGAAARDFKQVAIRAGELQRALNLFHDFTEYAGKEIVIIDNFAKQPVFKMLAHVDPMVSIRILTTDRAEIDAVYRQLVADEKLKRKFEVRYLPGSKAEKVFHDRYVIRDGNEGWAWGASFHDSGLKQHTPSELKPVNLRTILADFEAAWSRAKVI